MDDEKKDGEIPAIYTIDVSKVPPFNGDKYGVDPAVNDALAFIDWGQAIQTQPSAQEKVERWITAIVKVSPKSSSFWYDYGKRYNEKVIMRISAAKDQQGRRTCDVLIQTRRTVGDVVLSAWTEYNRWVIDAQKEKGK
jgi:hypothetical protein